MEPNIETNLFELQVDHHGTAYLKETARWAKFLSIMGFVFCGLCVVVALFAGSIMAGLSGGMGDGRAGMIGSGLLSGIYIALGLLYFLPCLYLFNFASKMQAALRNNDQDVLNDSFKNLKSCYRFVGILMLIILGLWVLGIIFAVIGAAMH